MSEHILSMSEHKQDNRLIDELSEFGLTNPTKIADTLQGTIWRTSVTNSNKDIVVKITNKALQSKSIVIIDGVIHNAKENIVTETEIHKHLTYNTDECPNSIVKYINAVQNDENYFLLMEYGGTSLFEFIVKLHQLVTKGNISIIELQKVCKVIFKQMIECIEYIHSHNVCHMDISLENFLINDVNITIINNIVHFDCDMMQIKLCDFGLAESYSDKHDFYSNKFCGKPNYYSPEISNKETFNAKANDIWCLGVCLFMMITGSPPFIKSNGKSQPFNIIMNGDIVLLLNAWNKITYVNEDIINLFDLIFKYEKRRSDLLCIKKCSWLKD